MDEVIVIGDELNVAGFRLAGWPVRCPPDDGVLAAWEQALAEAQLVVVSRAAADAIGVERLQRAWLSGRPFVVVVPDIADPQPERGFTRRLRSVLGIDE